MDPLRARALAYRRSALYDGESVTRNARDTYRRSFDTGHGCSLCGARVDIPPELPELERKRRSEALRRAHFANLGSAASRARRKAAAS